MNARRGTAIPLSAWTDPDRCAAETALLRRSWQVAAPADAIPDPGWTPVSLLGTEVLLTREGGTVRAFVNACRHRGVRLASEAARGSALRCPFHAWTYRLDGALAHVPSGEGFDQLPAGLRPVRCTVWEGLVWVDLEGAAPPLLDHLGAAGRDFARLRLGEFTRIDVRSRLVRANWKSVLEIATEPYHVPAVHRRTIGAFTHPAARFEPHGPHGRVIFELPAPPWRRWLDARALPAWGDWDETDRTCQVAWWVFPNLLVNVTPYQMLLVRVEPRGPHRTRLSAWFHRRPDAGLLGRVRGRLSALASRAIWSEDLALLAELTRGRASADGSAPLHRTLEAAALHAHRELAQRL